MPVYILMEEMPYTELLKWSDFFSKQPYGWREDYRAGIIAKSMGMKEDIENIFPTIRMVKSASESAQKPDQAIPKGVMLSLMKRAKGAASEDKPEWIK